MLCKRAIIHLALGGHQLSVKNKGKKSRFYSTQQQQQQQQAKYISPGVRVPQFNFVFDNLIGVLAANEEMMEIITTLGFKIFNV